MKIHYHTESTVTCSSCGHNEKETMPLDACIYLYECTNCQHLMTPQRGDCCIFCSRGSHPCPTSQRESKAYAPIRQTISQANTVTQSSANQESIASEFFDSAKAI